MRDPEKFDAFYKDARERLLVQTFALTGDLAASRRAVRDAFIVTWHHWRKLSKLGDPETVVRPQAWRLAQRHHTARVWHRDKQISPDVKATLDALGKLSTHQRSALILTQLAAVSLPQMAREVGVTREVVERDLQQAVSQLSLQLDVSAAAMRPLFDAITAAVVATDDSPWPRATIIRRAGAARRRTHTGVGAIAAVTALVVSGVLVTNASGARPSLDRSDRAATRPGAAASGAGAESDAAGVTDPPPPTLTDTTLLGVGDLGARYDRDWRVVSTGTNDDGAGLVLPCQLERYADPRGAAALVRTFTTGRSKQQDTLSATQLTEASSSLTRSRRAYRTMTSWFGDCTQERVHLVSTGSPRGVGDQSVQVVLQSWGRAEHTYVIGVARTGVYTTTTLVASPLGQAPDASTTRASARLLSGAVDKLCDLPDAGACGATPTVLDARSPLTAGTAPAMLSAIDLPQLPGIEKPWVGTDPVAPTTNDAASSCDRTRFRGAFREKPFTNNATRTFVIPGAKLPTEFGLTQSLGSLPGDRAQGVVEQVRGALDSCDSINTDITEIARNDDRDTSLTAWRLEVDVTDERTVTFLMAIVRDDTSVSQLGFLPRTPDDLAPSAFVALAQRALQRLSRLPKPGRA